MTPGCVGPGPGAEEEPGHSTIFLPLPEICFHFQSPGPHLATQEIAGRAWSKAPPAWVTQVLWGPGRGHCGQNTLLPAQGPRRGAAHRLAGGSGRELGHTELPQWPHALPHPDSLVRETPRFLLAPGPQGAPRGRGTGRAAPPETYPERFAHALSQGSERTRGEGGGHMGGIGAPPRAFSSPVTPRWPLPVSSPAVGRGQPARGRP